MNPAITLDESDIAYREFHDNANQVTGTVDQSDMSENVVWMVPPISSPWLPVALRQLQAIVRLPKGWDSHGADPPARQIVASGAVLLVELARHFPGLPKPNIHPTRTGGVQFHWETGPIYLEVEVETPRTAHFYFEDKVEHRVIEDEIHVGQRVSRLMPLLALIEQ